MGRRVITGDGTIPDRSRGLMSAFSGGYPRAICCSPRLFWPLLQYGRLARHVLIGAPPVVLLPYICQCRNPRLAGGQSA